LSTGPEKNPDCKTKRGETRKKKKGGVAVPPRGRRGSRGPRSREKKCHEVER